MPPVRTSTSDNADLEVTINLDSSLDNNDSTSGIQPSTNR
jgi:hypothetical protein